MLKVSSSLWFEKDVQQAVEFYVATIPNSSMGRMTVLPAETPSGPPGSVKIIDFKLADQHFTAMEAGPFEAFNHAFSISVQCETQEEIDRIWNAFLTNGGVEEHCGWLKDRWGLSWQIVPRALIEMVADPDRERAKRVTETMLGMVKLDIAKLEAAFRG
ncbi:VOC family protein [Rhizobium sp. P32RR-XVIII]|uniref:VOC family protein n=1 Tax=Rhizobium sp. P32RR-XVIII TaxID=2726738 RepID=UPI00145632F8|nr:VOC family protein [Rhizobium sp. P32RR-XVIII]NLS02252.1 VOC family protein [Rhizobium sp. P32RR-XVIII]